MTEKALTAERIYGRSELSFEAWMKVISKKMTQLMLITTINQRFSNNNGNLLLSSNKKIRGAWTLKDMNIDQMMGVTQGHSQI